MNTMTRLRAADLQHPDRMHLRALTKAEILASAPIRLEHLFRPLPALEALSRDRAAMLRLAEEEAARKQRMQRLAMTLRTPILKGTL